MSILQMEERLRVLAMLVHKCSVEYVADGVLESKQSAKYYVAEYHNQKQQLEEARKIWQSQ